MPSLGDIVDAYREGATLGDTFNAQSGACPRAGTPEMTVAQNLVNAAGAKVSGMQGTAVALLPSEDRQAIREGNKVANHLNQNCGMKPGKMS